MQSISVIMPTRALPERAVLLRRALDSVLAQKSVRVVPLIIVNGPDADPQVVHELRRDARFRVEVLEHADLPAALRVGRRLVEAPYFAELDDDDVLLPDAFVTRLSALDEQPACDVVVTSGLRRGPNGDSPHVTTSSLVSQDPLRALCSFNWLLPGSWLCRTATVDGSLFERMPNYLECTWLAIQFATRYRMRFLDRPTVIWHTDSPLAVSKSRGYVLGQVNALQRILELDLPADVRAHFGSHVALACHAAAELHVREGARGAAIAWHLRSLREPGGWRFLPFTRRLLLRFNDGSAP